jgi:cytochrome oxidase Cu insertion factor (SCO1/SenC/PrrC family)
MRSRADRVARIERSEIRERRVPDFATLNPGYWHSLVSPARRITVLWLAVGALIALALLPSRLHAGEAPSAAQLMDDLMWSRGPIGGPFALTDHDGKRRTDAEFRGKLLVIYFGYTNCPDICPADLTAISLALERLGAAAEAVQPIFITLDPERDTAAHLAEYVQAFHPRLLGLTGTPDEIRKVATAYKAWYAMAGNAGGEDYAVDHTAFIYLVGKDGQYLGFLPPSTAPERLSDVIRQMLSR